VIDLADPLVTPYSPAWRRALDNRLERKACRSAAGVITTSRNFSTYLIQEHALNPNRVIEIEQGFESSEANGQISGASKLFPNDQFWMLYTGNFYRDFRNPEILLQALRQRPGVRLAYAGQTPDWLISLFAPLGSQVQCLGRMSHAEIVEIQQSAPVLFNLGNAQALQVPGKLYEYFGAGRPILHIALNPGDPSKEEISSRRRGIAVDAELEQVLEALDRLQAAWAVGALETEWNLSSEPVAEFSWEKRSEKLLGFLQSQLAIAGQK
jgi:glycosyltransferase involved in cell wall biosynthesis